MCLSSHGCYPYGCYLTPLTCYPHHRCNLPLWWMATAAAKYLGLLGQISLSTLPLVTFAAPEPHGLANDSDVQTGGLVSQQGVELTAPTAHSARHQHPALREVHTYLQAENEKICLICQRMTSKSLCTHTSQVSFASHFSGSDCRQFVIRFQNQLSKASEVSLLSVPRVLNNQPP